MTSGFPASLRRRVPASRPYFGWTLILVLGITTIISYGTTSYAFGVLVVPISSETGWSRAAISGAYSLNLLLAGILGVPIGRLVDRHGARLVMAAGSALSGLVLIGLSGVHAIWLFVLLWGFGLGLGTALTFYAVSFTVVANWFRRRRGTAMAWLTTLGGLASPVFIPLIGWLVPRLGWRETVLVLAATQIFIALPLHAIFVRRHPEDLGLAPDGEARADETLGVGNQRSAVPIGLTAAQALRRVSFWTLTLAGGADQLAAMVLAAHQIASMVARGFDPVLAAGIAGLIGVASLPGRFLLNLFSDRFGPQRLLALILAVLGLGVVVFAVASSVAWLYAYVVVYGIAFGTRSPLRASVMAEHFGRRAYGAITAIQGVVIAVPAAAGPLAAGWLYDALGNYQLAFWLTAGAFALASALVVLTPPPAQEPGKAPSL